MSGVRVEKNGVAIIQRQLKHQYEPIYNCECPADTALGRQGRNLVSETSGSILFAKGERMVAECGATYEIRN